MPVPPGLRMLLQLLSDLQLQVSRNCLNMSGPGWKCASLWWFSLQLQNFSTFSNWTSEWLTALWNTFDIESTGAGSSWQAWFGSHLRPLFPLRVSRHVLNVLHFQWQPWGGPVHVRDVGMGSSTGIHWVDKIVWRNYIHICEVRSSIWW